MYPETRYNVLYMHKEDIIVNFKTFLLTLCPSQGNLSPSYTISETISMFCLSLLKPECDKPSHHMKSYWCRFLMLATRSSVFFYIGYKMWRRAIELVIYNITYPVLIHSIVCKHKLNYIGIGTYWILWLKMGLFTFNVTTRLKENILLLFWVDWWMTNLQLNCIIKLYVRIVVTAILIKLQFLPKSILFLKACNFTGMQLRQVIFWFLVSEFFY